MLTMLMHNVYFGHLSGFFVFPAVQVEFSLSESQRTGFRKAVNVTVLKRNSEMRHKVRKLHYVSKFTQSYFSMMVINKFNSNNNYI